MTLVVKQAKTIEKQDFLVMLLQDFILNSN